MLRHTLVLLATAGLAGAAQAQVQVQGAWVRGMVAEQRATGAYLRITSQTPAKLVGVKTPAAGTVEIHQTKMEGGVMRMRRVEAIDLPAGEPVELKPGGYHVMLMQVARPLKEGETVPLTLIIESKNGRQEEVLVQAPVKPLSTPAHQQGKH